ncbi:ABC transporter ATP-binding protein [Metabacillus sp. GX 13764]|uniref:ABC transporter ATP-binding protein n=1 Tax=Metabacillus kandeliae TaxID=2900151 RepID=UPI001E30D060|nr:ABC transporter ATP-binding protein [Metabacillus kandeliae]MCD7035868.1 ABC transporter ATP-binding protein [Metabacillus kandeliae]
MLSLEDVSKTYKQQKDSITAVQRTDLTVKKGEFVSLIGPSGCGKSTILDIAAGLIPPTEGKVLFEGKDITGKVGYSAYMPQADVLLPWRTILENAVLSLEMKGIKKKEAKEKAAPLMELFGLKGFENHYPFMLSGGMRQRVSFLRTILYEKEMLLLDEPFGKLDAITRLNLQEWLLGICSQLNLTVLFITHDIDEAIYLSDRIYVMSKRPGKVIKEAKVPFGRPRTADVMAEREFGELKRELIGVLR